MYTVVFRQQFRIELNLKLFVFEDRIKTEVSEKNVSGQGWKPKTNLSKICLGATSEGFESRPHWSEANALTTLPPLLTL